MKKSNAVAGEEQNNNRDKKFRNILANLLFVKILLTKNINKDKMKEKNYEKNRYKTNLCRYFCI